MARKWNGEALVDELAVRLWDTSTANKNRIITWLNEIQDDIVSDIPIDYFKFKLKKLLPVSQDLIDMSPPIPGAPSVAIASGGSLVEDSVYKTLVTFLIYDADAKDYIESEAGTESSEVTATASDKTIDLTSIPTMDGDTSVEPSTIHRRVYLLVKADGETEFSEPLFIQDIEDNTTTTLSITAESTSTITPPSDTEVDQLASSNPYNLDSGKYLVRQDMDDLRRYDPAGSSSDTPSYFDHVGPHKIKLYPQLGASATTAQRTFTYFVFRRPHEVFREKTRAIDLPIVFKKALIEGVLWKGYEFRDRDGWQSKNNNYMMFKKEALNKLRRLKTRPSTVRDVEGDSFGYSV